MAGALFREPSLRAAIIICSAGIELSVTEICEKHLPVVEGRAHGRKVEALHRMKLIDDTARNLLGHLSDIRNEFAHREDSFDLTDPKVKSSVENFIGLGAKTYPGTNFTEFFQSLSKAFTGQLPAWDKPNVSQLIAYAAALKIYLIAVHASEQPVFVTLRAPKISMSGNLFPTS